MPKVQVDDEGNPIKTKVQVDDEGNPIRAAYVPDDAMMRSRIEHAQGVQPYSDNPADAPKPSGLMGALSHAANPKTTADMLSLVAPEVGIEGWVPGVRAAKIALRFAREEPHAPGAIGSIVGGVRGALRGLYRNATGTGWTGDKPFGITQESPRLVKAGTDVPVDLPTATSRVIRPPGTADQAGTFRDSVERDLGSALDKTVGAKDKLSDLDKAIAAGKTEASDARGVSGRREAQGIRAENTADTQEASRLARQDRYNQRATTDTAASDAEVKRLKDLRAANSAQYKYDEAAAAQKAKDARAANVSQFREGEATTAQTAKGVRDANVAQFQHDEAVRTAAARDADAAAGIADKAVENARKLQQQGVGVADRAVEATRRATEKLRQEGLGTADKAVEDATKRVGALQDQFETGTSKKAVRIDVGDTKAAEDAAKAKRIQDALVGREAQPPSISETISADGKTMRTAHTAPEVPVDADAGLLAQLGGDPDALARFKAAAAQTDATAAASSRTVKRPVKIVGKAGTTLAEEPASVALPPSTPTPAELDALFPTTDPLNRVKRQMFEERYNLRPRAPIVQSPMSRVAADVPPIHVDPASTAALGGEMTPMEQAALNKALNLKPGIRVTGLTDAGRAGKANVEALRTELGATKAGRQLGIDTQTVRDLSGGEAGLPPVKMMREMDLATAKMTPDEIIAYGRRMKDPNAAHSKYIKHLVDEATAQGR
jgi:hypothetical protein